MTLYSNLVYDQHCLLRTHEIHHFHRVPYLIEHMQYVDIGVRKTWDHVKLLIVPQFVYLLTSHCPRPTAHALP